MERYLGEKTPKLGFGLMRLPKLEDGSIDVEQTKEMVDMFMAAGLTYLIQPMFMTEVNQKEQPRSPW